MPTIFVRNGTASATYRQPLASSRRDATVSVWERTHMDCAGHGCPVTDVGRVALLFRIGCEDVVCNTQVWNGTDVGSICLQNVNTALGLSRSREKGGLRERRNHIRRLSWGGSRSTGYRVLRARAAYHCKAHNVSDDLATFSCLEDTACMSARGTPCRQGFEALTEHL
jgi:hypothetical protein